MQREYGWNFGAATESLVFNGQSTAPFSKSALTTLATDLAPAQATLNAVFRSLVAASKAPTALRKTTPAGDPDTFTPLKDALVPIFTPAMDAAYRRGCAPSRICSTRGITKI